MGRTWSCFKSANTKKLKNPINKIPENPSTRPIARVLNPMVDKKMAARRPPAVVM